MHVAALREFLTAQIARAKAEDVLFSVHLKATMMKVSDPIVFGHVVRAFFPKTFAQYGETLAEGRPVPERRARRHPATGLAALPGGRRDQGVVRRRAGRRPGAGDGRLRQGHHQPARAVRRDRRRVDAGHDPYVGPHVGPGRPGARHPRGAAGQQLRRASTRSSSTTAVRNGAFDPATMGSVPNVGLMAQKAEEYGSHDKTFEIADHRHGPARRPGRQRRTRAGGLGR